MVMKNVLLATEAGLGHGETPIFPIQIFRVKDGVNYNPGEPNYDLFKLACQVSRQAAVPELLVPWTRPSTCKYYKPGRPETEIAYMGCRTRVIGNVYDPSREICNGRGNLSLYLDQPAAHCDTARMATSTRSLRSLTRRSIWCIDQLNERFEIQARKHVYNYPVPDGAGRVAGQRKAQAGTTRCARCSSTARCPSASSALPRR